MIDGRRSRVGHERMEGMESPSAGAAKLNAPGDAPHLGGVPPAHRLRRAKGLRLVGVHAGRHDSDLRAWAPVRAGQQVARARAHGALGAVPAGAPGWAGQHHRLRPRGQEAVAAPPADARRAGGHSRVRRLRVLRRRRRRQPFSAPAGDHPRVFGRCRQVRGKSVGAQVRRLQAN